jgi:hypothetical protein
MSSTTSLKLPNALKATIAKVAAFAGADVKAYVLARVNQCLPQALPLDATKLMKPVHDRPARSISNRLLVLALRHQRESGYRT